MKDQVQRGWRHRDQVDRWLPRSKGSERLLADKRRNPMRRSHVEDEERKRVAVEEEVVEIGRRREEEERSSHRTADSRDNRKKKDEENLNERIEVEVAVVVELDARERKGSSQLQ